MPKKGAHKHKGATDQGRRPSRNEPCPCGSGKKYKHCCALKQGQRWSKTLIWIIGFAAAGLMGYGIAQFGSGNGPSRSARISTASPQRTYYTEADVPEVDFSELTGAQKEGVLGSINRVLCTCGCGLTLAQCVATDSTCPLRNSNINKIRAEVAKVSG